MSVNIYHTPDIFKNISSLELEQDENREAIQPISCSFEGKIALAYGTCFSVLDTRLAGEEAVQIEVEFDHTIEVMCWEPAGKLILIGDSNGSIHFATSAGVIVYSRRIIQGEASGTVFHSLQFSRGGTGELLLAVLNNGRVIGMQNLPLSFMSTMSESTDPAILAIHAKQLQVMLTSIPFEFPRRLIFLESVVDSGKEDPIIVLKSLVLDKEGKLYFCELGTRPLSSSAWTLHKHGSVTAGRPLLSGELFLDVISVHALTNCGPNLAESIEKENYGAPLVPSLLLSGSSYEMPAPLTVLLLSHENQILVFDTELVENQILTELDLRIKYSESLTFVSGYKLRSALMDKLPTSVDAYVFGISADQSFGNVNYFALLEKIGDSNQKKASGSGVSDKSRFSMLPLFTSESSVPQKGTTQLFPIGQHSTCNFGEFLLQARSNNSEFVVVGTSDAAGLMLQDLFRGVSSDNFEAPTDRVNSIHYLIGCVIKRFVVSSENELMLDARDRFFQSLLSAVSSLPSDSNVSAISDLAKCVLIYCRHPPSGFLDSFIEAVIESVAGLDDGSPAAEEIERLRRYESFLYTGRYVVLKWNPSEIEAKECAGNDERIRAVSAELIISMSSEDVSDEQYWLAWKHCVVSGCLAESNALVESHYGNRWPRLDLDNLNDILANLQIVSVDKSDQPLLRICPSDLAKWLEGSLIPELCNSNQLKLSDNTQLFAACCLYLRDQAVSLERAFGSPFEPLTLINLSMSISSKYCPGCMNARPEKSLKGVSIAELRNAFMLQAAIWMSWGDRPSSTDVMDEGLEGLIQDKLLDIIFHEGETAGHISDDQYSTFVSDQISRLIRPIADQFFVSLDSIILDWIRRTISNTLVVYHKPRGAEAAGDDENCVLFSRLICVISNIQDPNVLSSAILNMWQISTASSADSEQDSDAEAAQASSLERLARLATAIYPSVSSGRTKEELQESIRLLRLRSIAAAYGVLNFDVRSMRQLRGVVSLISSSYWNPNSILDAIEFAEAWTALGSDLSYVLGRALVARVYARDFTDKTLTAEMAPSLDLTEKRNLLEQAFRCIPEHRRPLSAETAVLFLVDRLDELGGQISSWHSSTAELTALKNEACYSCHGAVIIASLLLEESKNLSNNLSSESVSDKSRSTANLTGTFQKRLQAEGRSEDYITAALLSSLKRIRFLQSDYDIYISLTGIYDEKVCLSVGCRLAEERAHDLISQSEASSVNTELKKTNVDDAARVFRNDKLLDSACPMLSAKTRHACLLMEISPVYVEYKVISNLITMGKMALAIEVAKTLSFENSMEAKAVSTAMDNAGPNNLSGNSELVLNAAIALCSLVSRQAGTKGAKEASAAPVVKTFSLTRTMLQNSASTCSSDCLGKTLDLFGGCDFVVSCFDRFESATSSGKVLTSGYKAASSDSSNFQVAANISFSRDGILMSTESALGLLLKHVMKEIQRRSLASSAATSDRAVSTDSEDFVAVLQKSENHILAVRCLLNSWYNFDSKGKVLQSSLLHLSRKILAYRDIDATLGVACLSGVSYDAMVKELKQAVPSIQSDFSRLQTVAIIGEDLSRLWNQEDLLGVFQSLQTNAKWWHTLASHGIKIDPRAFQSSVAAQREACIRAVVPELLSKSNLNLELAVEYCCQFDVEGSYAALCYIEQILLGPLSSPNDQSWLKLVRQAGSTVNEGALVALYKKIFRRINPLDYEKIRYVSLWLIQTIQEDSSLFGDSNNNPMELKASLQGYSRCVDIITFLVGVSFRISGPQLVPAYISIFENIPPSSPYYSRLPLWMLIDDTWGVLGPIMSTLPEMCSKLTLLCAPLAIDINVFHSRRIMTSVAPFPFVVPNELSVVSNSFSKGSGSHELELEQSGACALALERIRDIRVEIQCIEDHLVRVEVWRWLIDREVEAENAVVAEMLLLTALEDTVLPSSEVLTESDGFKQLHEARGQMTLRLVQMQCRRLLSELISVDIKTSQEGRRFKSSASDKISVLLSLESSSNTEKAQKMLFEIAVEHAWKVQLEVMAATQQFGNAGAFSRAASTTSALSVWDIQLSRHFPQVGSFLRQVMVSEKKICIYCSRLDDHVRVNLKDVASATSTAGGQNAGAGEAIRHMFISRLLAEGHIASRLSEITSSGTPNSSVEEKNEYNASSKASGGSSAWSGFLGIGDSMVCPTNAASRRRSDVFSAFAISVLIYCCPDDTTRSAYVDQLQGLARSGAKSGGNRPARRFTGRSKFRAIQALRFMPINETGSGHPERYSWTVEDNDLWRFLFCLSELQELRLPCSEESLCEAVGFSLSDSKSLATNHEHDPRLLIRTLLGDEGRVSEVSELCRDILLCSGSCKVTADIWMDLVCHMESNGHHRALIDTLLILRHYRGRCCDSRPAALGAGTVITIDSLCTGDMAGSLLRVLSSFAGECSGKVQQVISLIINRGKINETVKKSVSSKAEDENRDRSQVPLNYSRVVLREVVSDSIWGVGDWEEAPEDLILCLEQLSVLWSIFSVSCSKTALSQLYTPGTEDKLYLESIFKSSFSNSLFSSFLSIVDASFEWVKWDMSEKSQNEQSNFHSVLVETALNFLGPSNAVVISRLLQACCSARINLFPSVVRSCKAICLNSSGTSFLFSHVEEDAISQAVLLELYIRMQNASRYPFGGSAAIAKVDKVVVPVLFEWLNIYRKTDWVYLLLSPGFAVLPFDTMSSLLDSRCLESGDLTLAKYLIDAIGDAWWQASSNDVASRRIINVEEHLSSSIVASRALQCLVLWCLSSRDRQLLLLESFSAVSESTRNRLGVAVESIQLKLLQHGNVDMAVVSKVIMMLKKR